MDSNLIYSTNALGYCMVTCKGNNDNYYIIFFNENINSSYAKYYHATKDELDHMVNWFTNATEIDLRLSYENRNIMDR